MTQTERRIYLRGKEVVFDLKYNWQYTEYKVARTEVPQNVMDALDASPYKDFHIDDIDCYETKTPKTPSYYRFELESGNTEVKINIDTNGTITK